MVRLASVHVLNAFFSFSLSQTTDTGKKKREPLLFIYFLIKVKQIFGWKE